MKDLFINAHEELIAQYLLDHPNATWDQACNATADGAYSQMRDKFADMADTMKQKLKDEGKWP